LGAPLGGVQAVTSIPLPWCGRLAERAAWLPTWAAESSRPLLEPEMAEVSISCVSAPPLAHLRTFRC